MTISQQFHQLPMFMTGEELSDLHSGDYNKRAGDVTRRDYHYSHGMVDGVTDYREGSPSHDHYIDVLKQGVEKEQGIVEPVHVWHPDQGPSTLIDGHHRTKVARQTGRLVPVIHHGGELDNVHQSVFLKDFDLG